MHSLMYLAKCFDSGCYSGRYGAGGGSRTHTRSEPHWILSPARLPFRHSGLRSERGVFGEGHQLHLREGVPRVHYGASMLNMPSMLGASQSS